MLESEAVPQRHVVGSEERRPRTGVAGDRVGAGQGKPLPARGALIACSLGRAPRRNLWSTATATAVAVA
jgi:hypothetical protein